MHDTIEDMDIGIEKKDEKNRIFRKKRLPDSKFNDEMNKRGINKISSKRKSDRIMDRFKNSPNNHI